MRIGLRNHRDNSFGNSYQIGSKDVPGI